MFPEDFLDFKNGFKVCLLLNGEYDYLIETYKIIREG